MEPVFGKLGRHKTGEKPRIRRFPRRTYLGNRVFKSHTVFVDACWAAWNAFAAEPKRIAAIATPPRDDWASVIP